MYKQQSASKREAGEGFADQRIFRLNGEFIRGLSGRIAHEPLPTEYSVQVIRFLFSSKNDCDVCRKKVSAIPGHMWISEASQRCCAMSILQASVYSPVKQVYGATVMQAQQKTMRQRASFFTETKYYWSLIECLTAQLLLVLLFFVCLCSVCAVCAKAGRERSVSSSIFWGKISPGDLDCFQQGWQPGSPSHSPSPVSPALGLQTQGVPHSACYVGTGVNTGHHSCTRNKSSYPMSIPQPIC